MPAYLSDITGASHKLSSLSIINKVMSSLYVYKLALVNCLANISNILFGFQEYTAKQLTSLVTCGVGSHVTKKGKQKLLAIIEDMERSKAR